MTKKTKLKDYINQITIKNAPISTGKKDGFVYIKPVANETVSSTATNYTNVMRFNTDQGDFYFKELSKKHIVAELVCAYCAEELGITVIDPHPVMYDGKMGVLMPSYIDDPKTTVRYPARKLFERQFGKFDNYTCNGFILFETIKRLAQKGEFGKVKLSKDMIFELSKVAIFDFLTRQTDRNNCNIEFLLKQKKDTTTELTLAPLFDNSFTFEYDSKLYDELIQNIDKGKITHKKIIDKRGLFGVKDRLRLLLELPRHQMMEFFKNEYVYPSDMYDIDIDKYSEENLENIAKVINCNPEINKFWKRVQKLDMSKIFQKIEKAIDAPLDDKCLFVTKTLFNHQRDVIAEAVSTYYDERT